jgi:hypothetical protein
MQERVSISESAPEIRRFATALEGVARDARFVEVLGLSALKPAAEHFAREARVAGATTEQLIASLKACLAPGRLIPRDREADTWARGQVLRWATEAFARAR